MPCNGSPELMAKPTDGGDRRKLIAFDDETFQALDLLARDRMSTFQELADEAFEKFVTTQTVSAVYSRELRTVFVAFLLDPVSRKFLEQGKFPDLRARDANLYGALSSLPQVEREALVRYLQTEVSLKDFEKAA